jgi:hypothetical protein
MDPAYPRRADGAIVNRRFTMQRLHPVAAVAVLLGLVTACGEGTVDTTTPTPSTTTTTTLATTTTTEAEPTTTAPVVLSGPLLVANPTGWDGNLVRLTTLDGTAVTELATDRHWPWVELITGDGSGGLLAVASPPPFAAGAVIRLASGSLEPELAYVPEQGWRVVDVDALFGKDGQIALVVTERSGEERRETMASGETVDEYLWAARVWLVPSEGSAVPLVEAGGFDWVELGELYGRAAGDPSVGTVSVGGDLVAVLRHDGSSLSAWIELFDATGEMVEVSDGPALRWECQGLAFNGFTHRTECRELETAELSSDGRYLVTRGRHEGDAVAVVVYRLEDGAEVGRIGGAWDHLFDGDRTILARTGDERMVVATISDSGLEVDQLDLDPMQEWPMTLLAGVTLDPQASWIVAGSPPACSAAGMDPDLPAIDGLPPEVEATRRRIAELAVACDFAGLADLAARDSEFIIFGASPCNEDPRITDLDPVGPWYRADLGQGKLRVLVETLAGSPELTEPWQGAGWSAFLWRGRDYLTGIAPDGTWRIDSVSPTEPCETIWCTC